MEMYEGMGFDENNYSPIPPVNRATSQSRSPRPTSTPKPEEERNLNKSDPTHNRGKINRVNSFESAKNPKQKCQKEDLSKVQVQRVIQHLVAATKCCHTGQN